MIVNALQWTAKKPLNISNDIRVYGRYIHIVYTVGQVSIKIEARKTPTYRGEFALFLIPLKFCLTE